MKMIRIKDKTVIKDLFVNMDKDGIIRTLGLTETEYLAFRNELNDPSSGFDQTTIPSFASIFNQPDEININQLNLERRLRFNDVSPMQTKGDQAMTSKK